MTETAGSANQTAGGPQAEFAIEVRNLQTGYFKRPVSD